MKGRRILSLALAALTAVSLLTVSASAAGFSDMVGHWARDDVEYLAAQGVVKGTSATTFAPDQKMTACEALLFCSRAAGVSEEDKAAIAADWADELAELLPDSLYSWAAEEMAVCLETGILSVTELRALSADDGLLKTISRESLAMYLVRAMQLDAMAKNLSTYPMDFADTSSISAALQPYVYLLDTYGIVRGNEANCFLPKSSLTRAEMATMLRRAMDFMEERGLYAELPAYTDYDWVGGTITEAAEDGAGGISLTLTSTITGTQTVTLPAGVTIYENNMRASAEPLSLLQTGTYARVNLDGDGSVLSVRLGGAVTAYTGTVTDIEPGSVTLDVNGVSRRLEIDRFTAIQADGVSIPAQVLSNQGGYTTAACQVDAMGHLAALQLSSGGRTEEGILRAVDGRSGSQTLTVTAFDGGEARYTLPSGTAVTVDGGAGSMSDRYEGCYVNLRVSNDSDGRLTAVSVDTGTQYLQGTVQTVVTNPQNGLALTDMVSGRNTAYLLTSQAAVRYNGETARLSDVPVGAFATLRLSDGYVTWMDAYPGAANTVKGVLDTISYGDVITLRVRTDSGEAASVTADAAAPPTVTRDGRTGSLESLRTGDTVVLTLQGGLVTAVEAQAQSVTVTGTVTRTARRGGTVTLDVRLSDGSAVTYEVDSAAPATRDGRSIDAEELNADDWVELVVHNGVVESITAYEDAGRNTRLEGTVLETDTRDETLRVRLSDGGTLTVDVSGASFLTADGGSTSLRRLSEDDRVQLFGDYSGNRFVATLVILL